MGFAVEIGATFATVSESRKLWFLVELARLGLWPKSSRSISKKSFAILACLIPSTVLVAAKLAAVCFRNAFRVAANSVIAPTSRLGLTPLGGT